MPTSRLKSQLTGGTWGERGERGVFSFPLVIILMIAWKTTLQSAKYVNMYLVQILLSILKGASSQ